MIPIGKQALKDRKLITKMIQNNKLMNESRMRQSLLSEEQRGDIKDWRTDLFDAFNKNYFVVNFYFKINKEMFSVNVNKILWRVVYII